MRFILNAACGCNKGKIRANNEDNFYFDGVILPAVNQALTTTLTKECWAENECCFAVFDGMGGEQFGEWAAYAAASRLRDCLASGGAEQRSTDVWLNDICLDLNRAVVEKAKELLTRHMGSTLAGLYFTESCVYSFNLGDSRIYNIRNGEIHQVSVDHVDSRALFSRRAKPSLTQHLGIDEEEFVVEPSIALHELLSGEYYLICSDGVTDMLSDAEICEIVLSGGDAERSVQRLISAALDKGGKDNITAIVCKVV